MRRRGSGRGETQETRRVKGRQKGPNHIEPKWLDYIGKGNWGKSSPAPRLEEFRVGGMVYQSHPVTGRDWEDADGQVHFDMLNKYLN